MEATRRGFLGTLAAIALAPRKLFAGSKPLASPSAPVWALELVAVMSDNYSGNWMELPSRGQIAPGTIVFMGDDGFVRASHAAKRGDRPVGFVIPSPTRSRSES